MTAIPLHKAIIVVAPDVAELNELLAAGWIVQHTCGMPSSSYPQGTMSLTVPVYSVPTAPLAAPPTCLVILRSPPS